MGWLISHIVFCAVEASLLFVANTDGGLFLCGSYSVEKGQNNTLYHLLLQIADIAARQGGRNRDIVGERESKRHKVRGREAKQMIAIRWW